MTIPDQPQEEVQLEENIILYKRRWLILAIYGFASFLNATLLTTFAPISPQLVNFYQLSEDKIDFLSLLFIITFLPGILTSVYLSRGHGFATCFKVGALFQAVGTGIRMFPYILPSPSPTLWYSMMFIGQIICGLSQPMLTSIAPQLASLWFGADESIAAQFIGSLSNPLGIAIGALYSRAIVQANSNVDTGMQIVVLSQALCSGLVLVLGLLYFDENPPTPPSLTAIKQWQEAQDKITKRKKNVLRQDDSEGNYLQNGTINNGYSTIAIGQSFDGSADDVNNVSFAHTHTEHFQTNENSDEDRINSPLTISLSNKDHLNHDEKNSDVDFDDSIWEHFKETMGPAIKDFTALMRDKNFLCLVVPFGLGMTIFNAIVSLPNKVLGPFSDVDASNMTATIICVGLVSCIIWSIVLELTKQFRFCLKIGYIMAGCSVSFFFSQLHHGITQTYLYILFSGLGFMIIPLLPLAVENAQEMTYPIHPQITTAILLTFGQLPSIPGLLIFMSLLKRDDYPENPLRSQFGIVVCSLLVLALLLTMFYTGESKRQQVNQVREGDYAEIDDRGNGESDSSSGFNFGGFFGRTGGELFDKDNNGNQASERVGLLSNSDGNDRILNFSAPPPQESHN